MQGDCCLCYEDDTAVEPFIKGSENTYLRCKDRVGCADRAAERWQDMYKAKASIRRKREKAVIFVEQEETDVD